MSFCVAGACIVHLVKSEQAVRVFRSCPETMADVGHLKRIWKDACRLAGAVQETCSSEMLEGQGAAFLREVDFGASDLQIC